MATVELTKCNLVIFLSGTVFSSVHAQAWPESIHAFTGNDIFALYSTLDDTAVS